MLLVCPMAIFLFGSGLLEALDSVDELAAVIAHELDHFFQHDSINRVVKLEHSRQVQTGVMIAGSIVGAGLGAFAGAAMSSASQMAAGTMSATGQMASNVISNTVNTMSNMVGQSMADSISSGYSRGNRIACRF